MSLTPDIAAQLLAALADDGYAVCDGFLTSDETNALRADAIQRHTEGQFARAAIGRASRQHTADQIRRDAIFWLDENTASPAENNYLGKMRDVISLLNRELFLGLDQGEFHYAQYPIGGFYKRHLDRFRDDDARVISCICYLNADWQDEDGGHLRLWLDQQNATTLDIAPLGGRLVAFVSDRFWHEVLPAQRERWSMTGWLRRRVS